MFYDIKDFPYLEAIRNNVNALSEEFERQKEHPLLVNLMNDIMPLHTRHLEYWTMDGGIHVEQLGHDVGFGGTTAFTLFKKGFPIKQYDVDEILPYTMKQVLTVPNINFSAYFRVPPGGGTVEHAHVPKNMIFHLCLFDVDGETYMRCDGHEKVIQKRGDYAIFDYSKPHSSHNASSVSRLNLIVDFTPEAHFFKS